MTIGFFSFKIKLQKISFFSGPAFSPPPSFFPNYTYINFNAVIIYLVVLSFYYGGSAEDPEYGIINKRFSLEHLKPCGVPSTIQYRPIKGNYKSGVAGVLSVCPMDPYADSYYG